MNLRIAVPCLSANSRLVTARSPLSDYRADRHYPQRVEAWDEFQQSVRKFRAKQKNVQAESILGVEQSLTDLAPTSSERSEEDYLNRNVLDPLMVVGLIGTIVIGSKNCQGEPDFSIIMAPKTNKNNIKVVGESKATHNLPLPMKAQEVARQYNDVRAAVDQLSEQRSDRNRRPLGWSHVGHPVSQILGYMILNHCHYGVLTSGSRTYFIHIKRNTTRTGEERVLISDAWFVGQEDYLRAWAFFYARACKDTQSVLDTPGLSQAWLEGTPDKVKKRPPSPPPPADQGTAKRRFWRGRGGGEGRGGAKLRSRSAGGIIPMVTLNDFKVGQPIGYGRHGTTFSGMWNN